MRTKIILLGVILGLAIAMTAYSETSSGNQVTPKITFDGLKIFVSDLGQAEEFYQGILGFPIASRDDTKIVLQTETWPITLERTNGDGKTEYPAHARTGLTLQTFKLLPQIALLKESGVAFYDSLLSKNGVGISIPFKDPFGNVLSLIEVQIRPAPAFEGVRIYNTGVTISKMPEAVAFYEDLLGFQEWSRDYLPAALPLKHSDGSFAFMIHYKEGLKKSEWLFGQQPHLVLVLSTSDPNEVKRLFQKQKVNFMSEKNRIILQDVEGNSIEIIEKQ